MISTGILAMALAVLGMWLADKYTENGGGEVVMRLGFYTFVFGLFSVAAGMYAWVTRLPPW
jgi:hypothetical protein